MTPRSLGGGSAAPAFRDARPRAREAGSDPQLTELADFLSWLHANPTALTEADLRKLGGPEEMGVNVLSWLGNRVSYHLRRRVLLNELEAAAWNMAAVSKRLRLGYGSGPALRSIRELGLTPEYEAAKTAGKIKRGGAR